MYVLDLQAALAPMIVAASVATAMRLATMVVDVLNYLACLLTCARGACTVYASGTQVFARWPNGLLGVVCHRPRCARATTRAGKCHVQRAECAPSGFSCRRGPHGVVRVKSSELKSGELNFATSRLLRAAVMPQTSGQPPLSMVVLVGCPCYALTYTCLNVCNGRM